MLDVQHFGKLGHFSKSLCVDLEKFWRKFGGRILGWNSWP